MEGLEVSSSISIFSVFLYFFAHEFFYVMKNTPKRFKIKHLAIIWTGESLVNITRQEMIGHHSIIFYQRKFPILNEKSDL